MSKKNEMLEEYDFSRAAGTGYPHKGGKPGSQSSSIRTHIVEWFTE